MQLSESQTDENDPFINGNLFVFFINFFTLPFASKFCLAFLVKEESGVTVSPAVPFHNLLPVEK